MRVPCHVGDGGDVRCKADPETRVPRKREVVVRKRSESEVAGRRNGRVRERGTVSGRPLITPVKAASELCVGRVARATVFV